MQSQEAQFNEARYGDVHLKVEELVLDDRVNSVIRLVKKLGGKRILDVGCTDGFLSQEFRKQGLYAIGVDASAKAIENARGRCDEVHVADLGKERLPLPDACVDLIWAGEIIEHIYDTEAFAEELLRVMQPGGRLLLSTPNLASWINRISLLLGAQPFYTEVGVRPSNSGSFLRKVSQPAGHIRVFTPSALRNLLVSVGWTFESMHGAGIIQGRMFRGLDKAISRAFPSLATDLICICRK
jgi:2-polyprenyl-3-methyl-5-hydroxy-6-metoxy-1,4-benzoquinol methylase